MLREVELPEGVTGGLLLCGMPGRHQESFDHARLEIMRNGIGRVVSLAPVDEIRMKSPDYHQAITSNRLPWKQEMLPIPDYGVPEDREAFLRLAQTLAHCLLRGERLLIHCGAGIGRTGTFAICLLLALGQSLANAQAAVQLAGSSPETSEQEGLIAWAAVQLNSDE